MMWVGIIGCWWVCSRGGSRRTFGFWGCICSGCRIASITRAFLGRGFWSWSRGRGWSCGWWWTCRLRCSRSRSLGRFLRFCTLFVRAISRPAATSPLASSTFDRFHWVFSKELPSPAPRPASSGTVSSSALFPPSLWSLMPRLISYLSWACDQEVARDPSSPLSGVWSWCCCIPWGVTDWKASRYRYLPPRQLPTPIPQNHNSPVPVPPRPFTPHYPDPDQAHFSPHSPYHYPHHRSHYQAPANSASWYLPPNWASHHPITFYSRSWPACPCLHSPPARYPSPYPLCKVQGSWEPHCEGCSPVLGRSIAFRSRSRCWWWLWSTSMVIIMRFDFDQNNIWAWLDAFTKMGLNIMQTDFQTHWI